MFQVEQSPLVLTTAPKKQGRPRFVLPVNLKVWVPIMSTVCAVMTSSSEIEYALLIVLPFVLLEFHRCSRKQREQLLVLVSLVVGVTEILWPIVINDES